MVSQWNSWNISKDSPHCSSATKSKSSCQKMTEKPEEFSGRTIFMSMFNDILWGSQDFDQECESNANLVSFCERRFPPRRWSFFGPGSEKKCYSTHDSRAQGEWDRVAEFVNRAPSHVTFSRVSALTTLSHVTLAQGASARQTIHVSCACVSDSSSTLHFALFSLCHLLLHPPDLPLHLLCGSVRS